MVYHVISFCIDMYIWLCYTNFYEFSDNKYRDLNQEKK